MERTIRRHVAKMRRMSSGRRVRYLDSLPADLRHSVARAIARGDV